MLKMKISFVLPKASLTYRQLRSECWTYLLCFQKYLGTFRSHRSCQRRWIWQCDLLWLSIHHNIIFLLGGSVSITHDVNPYQHCMTEVELQNWHVIITSCSASLSGNRRLLLLLLSASGNGTSCSSWPTSKISKIHTKDHHFWMS